MTDVAPDGRTAGASGWPRGQAPPKSAKARTHGLDVFGLPALAAALLIALLVRTGLSRYPLWYDELASAFFASQPFSRLWGGWMVRETNPPLYYSALRLWIDAFGLRVGTLRGLSIAGSLAAIAVTYSGMRDRFGAQAAAVAALILALSAQHLAFAEEVRAYVFVYGAVAVSFFGLLRVADDGSRTRAGWIAYILGALAAIYLHTTALLWPAAASLALLAVDRRFRPVTGDRWWSLVAADLAIGAGASWWLAITAAQMRVPNGNIGWIGWPGWDQIPALLIGSVLPVRRVWDGPEILLAAVGVLAIWGAAATWGRRETRLAVASLGFAAALFVLASLKQPIMLTRTLFWLSVFPLVPLSAGIATLRGWPFAAVAAALFMALALNLVRVAPTLPAEHWAEAAETLARDPRGVLVVDGESMAVAMRMTCATALHADPCPFPILTLLRPDDDVDHWARGAVAEAAPGPALPADPAVYLFRRGLHDVLSDLATLGVLRVCGAADPGQNFELLAPNDNRVERARALLPLPGEGGPATAGTDGVLPAAADPIRRPSGATFPGAGKESQRLAVGGSLFPTIVATNQAQNKAGTCLTLRGLADEAGSLPAALIGPLPSSVLVDIGHHGRWEGTLFHPDRPVPIR